MCSTLVQNLGDNLLAPVFLTMAVLANLTEEMVMTAKVEDLKEILRRRGLDITGRKTDLQDRAKDWLKANPKVSDVTTSPANGSGEVVDGAYGGQERRL